YYNDKDITFQQISNDAPINRNFEAFKNGEIYACNTAKIWFYEEVPFHPHWLLADMISIFHPELGVKPYPGKKYYSKPNK
ncbi:MAG: iron ABC transporter substrate-binding protein, partial [Muribaculaceae bacterium]|nr:iron ABC transporter substrate-binding protein [Muribaculaceae bacterium]